MSTLPTLAKSSDNADLIVRGKRIIAPEGECQAAIHIRGGVIIAITSFDDIAKSVPIHDAGDRGDLPGLVDTHVHINEPGRTDWEGFATATQAAAAGGVTTLVEMPLNSIPATTTAAAYREKLAAAEGKLWVDIGFWGGVVPGNARELQSLWDAGRSASNVSSCQAASMSLRTSRNPIFARLCRN